MRRIIRQSCLKNGRHFIFLSMVAVVSLFLFAFTSFQHRVEWLVPLSAANTKNPVASNTESLAAGKQIYTDNCVTCHGIYGKGDGTKSSQLNTKPRDFTSDKFQKQADGSIFWKLSQGRDPMLSFEKYLTEEQRWQVINYLRTFGSKK